MRASYIGLSVRKRLTALLFTHATRSTRRWARSPALRRRRDDVASPDGEVLQRADAVIEGLAQKDARASAKELADVADDMARASARSRPSSGRRTPRVSADHSVLGAGAARALDKLGTLGHDLGEITRRISFASTARTRRRTISTRRSPRAISRRAWAMPDPSLGSHGRGGRAGAESGGSPAPPDEGESEGDEAAEAFDEAARDLSQLAIDHADEMGKVERDGSDAKEDLKQMAKELKDRAEKVRQAVKGCRTWARAPIPRRARRAPRASKPSRWRSRSKRAT